MRLSRTDLVAPVLAIVLGGVIGVSLTHGASYFGRRPTMCRPSPTDSLRIPWERRSPAQYLTTTY